MRTETPSGSSCIFCRLLAGEEAASFVAREEAVAAFLDIRPVRPGHVLVVPIEHAARLEELPGGVAEEMWGLARRIAEAQCRHRGARGHHFLVNDGPAANQTVGHAHLHVVPRRAGDLGRILLGLGGHFVRLLLRRPISARARERLDREAEELRQVVSTRVGPGATSAFSE